MSRLCSRWLPLVILSLASAAVAAAKEPIALAPQNNHYFFWNDKPAILVTSGEHYGAVLNLDFDFDRYLAALASDGLNLTRTFSGTYREVPASFGITENTLAPKPNRYACPWARSGTPGCSDGGNRFDLTRWDEAYFLRLKRFMAAAQKHGVVVEMNLFCPLYDDALWAASPMNSANNVNGLGSFPRTEALTLKHPRLVELQLAFTRKVVGELNEFDNLYFEVCNEPYFGGVAQDWQYRIADTIVAAEKGLPHKHLISLNVANGWKKVDSPHPAVSIFNFHYCVPPDTIGMNYSLNKVIGENETGFRGKDDFLYRSEGWDFLLAGGGLYGSLDYSFTPSHPDGTLLDYQSPGGGSPQLRKQLGILKRFLEGFDFVRMKPGDSVIKSVSGGLSARTLVEDGKAYAVYLHAPLPEHPKKTAERPRDRVRAALVVTLPAGLYLAEWIDTTTGLATGSEQFKHRGGDKSLRSPAFIDDMALRIVRNLDGRIGYNDHRPRSAGHPGPEGPWDSRSPIPLRTSAAFFADLPAEDPSNHY